MAEYVCKLADSTGRVFEQVETALSEGEARQRLADRGFFVYSIRRHLGVTSKFRRSGSKRLLRGQDFLIFNQQFNTLIKAGLPILTALDLLAERAASPKLRPMLTEVRQRVRDGALLSDALVAQEAFPPVYTTSVMAGEKSGNLTGVLDQYIAYQRTSTMFVSRLKNILIYPAILIVAVTVVLTYLVTGVVPKFADLYTQLNVQLPLMTRIVLSFSVPLRNHLLLIVVCIAVTLMVGISWMRSDSGAIAMDRLKPKIPIAGDVWLKAQVAQFVRTLSTLLSGGTPLVTALDTASEAMGSPLIASSVRKAAADVRQGTPLHAALVRTDVIPPLALEMIEVGEASGALAPMLTSVAEFYEQEVDLKLTAILAYIEPAILVVMAAVVAFILIALYLPMFSLTAGAVGGGR
jgi:type IV pilus assembly protein PilC